MATIRIRITANSVEEFEEILLGIKEECCMSERETASIAHILPRAMNMFSGHIPSETPIVDFYEPDCLPHITRAIVVFLLPNGGRCSIVDLLHPTETKTPRCGYLACRCMVGWKLPSWFRHLGTKLTWRSRPAEPAWMLSEAPIPWKGESIHRIVYYPERRSELEVWKTVPGTGAYTFPANVDALRHLQHAQEYEDLYHTVWLAEYELGYQEGQNLRDQGIGEKDGRLLESTIEQILKPLRLYDGWSFDHEEAWYKRYRARKLGMEDGFHQANHAGVFARYCILSRPARP